MRKISSNLLLGVMLVLTASMAWTRADTGSQLETYKAKLAHERELRERAEHIEYKLIQEAADAWCGDHIDDLWRDIRQCEEKDISKVSNCQECWDAWNFDMEGSCRSMMYDFENSIEDTILLRSALLLWDDYAEARHADCRSRKLKTVDELHRCLGPADDRKGISDALEAMFIHQQSKSLAQ